MLKLVNCGQNNRGIDEKEELSLGENTGLRDQV